jgi:ribosome biogenesis GTPase
MAVFAHAANKSNPDTHHIMTPIDFASLRSIGLTQHVISQLHLLQASFQLGRLTQVHRSSVAVHDGTEEGAARALPQLAGQLVVGDWVGTSIDANGDCWVVQRLDPLTQIARRTQGQRSQALVSNVDTALLVMGLDNDFNPRRLERYIALVQVAGVAPVVVLTKADIGVDVDGQLAQLRQRLPATVPIMAVNGHQPQGLEPWLGVGQTLVLLGTSGAGKSTLTNALCGSDQLTGGLRHGDGRGRHTTTARSLHRCTDGACIIDTPGLRSWRPDADEDTLAASFDDIAELAERCQFRDCQHEAEPGCAVREAVDQDRLFNYHKLMREARRATQTPQDRINERARWKVMMKAGKERGRAKKGL